MSDEWRELKFAAGLRTSRRRPGAPTRLESALLSEDAEQ